MMVALTVAAYVAFAFVWLLALFGFEGRSRVSLANATEPVSAVPPRAPGMTWAPQEAVYIVCVGVRPCDRPRRVDG